MNGVLATILAALSVIFFHSRYLINWDAGQFALGTVLYSLADHTPHPPGYFLFVTSGKTLALLMHDVNAAFIVLSALASVLTLLFFYHAVRIANANSARTASIAALFLFLNPVFFTASRVALTYSFEALALCLSLFCASSILTRNRSRVFLLNCAGLALLAGFRPSVILASVPLLVFQAWHLRKKINILFAGSAIGALVVSAWFLPFANASGGLSEAMNAIRSQAEIAYTARLFDTTSASLFVQSLLFAMNALLAIGLSAGFGTVRGASFRRTVRTATAGVRGIFQQKNTRVRQTMAPKDSGLDSLRHGALASAITITVFFLFFHFGEVGYILALVPSLLFLLAPLLSRLPTAALIPLVFLQLALISMPLDWTGNRKLAEANMFAVQRHDSRMDVYLSAAHRSAPNDVAIVVLRGQYYDAKKNIRVYRSEDIRALSYYLPEYTLIDLLGTSGFYTTAHLYKKTEHRSQKVTVEPSAKKLLIFADYIHPETYPKGVTIRLIASNIYAADLSGVDTFVFNNFSFVREKK